MTFVASIFSDNSFTGHYSLTQISMDVDLVWKSFKLLAEIKLLISPANNKRCHFASARPIIKRNFFNSNISFWQYFSYHWKDFHEKSHLAHYTHVLQTQHVCFWSVNNYGHCKWTTMYLLAVSSIPMERFSKSIYTSHSPACIPALIGGIFVKIHSPHTFHTHNKWNGLDVIYK